MVYNFYTGISFLPALKRTLRAKERRHRRHCFEGEVHTVQFRERNFLVPHFLLTWEEMKH